MAKITNRMKAKIWTETMTMEIDADIIAGIELAFYSVPVEKQQQLITKLLEIAAKLKEAGYE